MLVPDAFHGEYDCNKAESKSAVHSISVHDCFSFLCSCGLYLTAFCASLDGAQLSIVPFFLQVFILCLRIMLKQVYNKLVVHGVNKSRPLLCAQAAGLHGGQSDLELLVSRQGKTLSFCSHGGVSQFSPLMNGRSLSLLLLLLAEEPYFAPRSFFGVEDFVDDDNSRPYTYQKGKKSKNPNKHVSFKQRTVAYMEPFTLDVFISKRFVSASITHRVTSKQVAVAGTNSKDIKAVLRSRSDIPACIAIGRILSERAREADVYTASYTPRDRDKFEGKIRAVVQSLFDNGIDVKVYLD
ncbi:hypothetical protein M9H77_06923 [Catharanthus roseus]|uniref:Uncharacterized protein n=1 Tax=Catharanthus roseus TaxID=4058 RepID=A0ACC0BTW2_CATRO|nr:hypothetical protein M9H77_06923 [Catharanthus roseus]